MLIFVNRRIFRLSFLCPARRAPCAMGTASAVASALPLLFSDDLPNDHADDEQRRKNNDQNFIPLHQLSLRSALFVVIKRRR